MTSGAPPRRFDAFAEAVLFAGAAARVLMPDDVRPDAEAIAVGMLFLGGGLILLDRRDRIAPAGAAALTLPWLLLFVAWRGDDLGTKRAVDFAAAAVAGLAWRDLALRPGGAGRLRRVWLGLALLLAAFALAEAAWIGDEARAAAAALSHKLTRTEQGRAFLESRRVRATFTSPNAFAGFLLLWAPAAAACAAAARRARAWPWAAAAALGAAFVAAGSAGAAFAAALGVCVTAARVAPRTSAARRAGRVGAGTLACAAVALVVAAACGLADGGKLATLRERVDYHRTAARLLGDAGLLGFGFESYRTRAAGALAPGESFSRYVHDWWLQGWLEAGVFFALFAVAVLFRVRRAVDAADITAPSATPEPSARPAIVGVLAGVLIAGLIHPFVAFLPASWEAPVWADASLTTCAAAACLAIAARLPADGVAYGRGAAVGLVAFLLHGLVDFDLYMPGVALAFAGALALAPGAPASEERRSEPAAVGFCAMLGAAACLAPLVVLEFARRRAG